jgi:hypothetical protein
MSKVPGALERKRIAEEQKNKIGGVRAQYAEPMAKNAMEMSNILLGLRNKYGERSELAKIRGLESNAELSNDAVWWSARNYAKYR